MKALVKISLVGGVLFLGWRMDGSWKGAAAWAIVLWCGWLLFHAIQEHPKEQAKPVRKEFQRTQDFTEKVEKRPSRRGERLNPDPTRPTEDDHAALITVAIERLRGN